MNALLTKKLILLILIISPALLLAQAKKPEVLIYGSGIEAYTAAIQSAKSNLNTVWVWEAGISVRDGLSELPQAIDTDHQLDAGIWADLLAGAKRHKQRSDSVSAQVKQRLNIQLLINAMDSTLAVYPHLTVLRNTTGSSITAVKKNKRNYRIDLANHTRYTVRSVVDASADGLIARLAGEEIPSPKTSLDREYYTSNLFQEISRTGVAVSDSEAPHPYTLPLGSLIPNGESNLFLIKRPQNASAPLMAHIGQAVGAAAAYVAFYKTTADKINIRPVQAEILQYGARLVPYQDIRIDDPNFAAIQRIGATGLFYPAPDAEGNYLFQPQETVSTRELEPTLNQLFSRSQIWFYDNKSEKMTMTELLSLIKYIGHKGNELEGQVQKEWTRTFKFTGQYDPEMTVSRRHVAALLDEYCKPFAVRIGFPGDIHR